MNAITAAYDTSSPSTQEILGQPVEILETPFEPTVGWEVAFQRRLDTRLSYSDLLRHVCLDYDLGCVTAEDTLQRLKDLNLFGTVEQFITTYSAGVRALAEGGR